MGVVFPDGERVGNEQILASAELSPSSPTPLLVETMGINNFSVFWEGSINSMPTFLCEWQKILMCTYLCTQIQKFGGNNGFFNWSFGFLLQNWNGGNDFLLPPIFVYMNFVFILNLKDFHWNCILFTMPCLCHFLMCFYTNQYDLILHTMK